MDAEYERQTMVEAQLRERGIRDERVLSAMVQVPRHLFLPAETRADAYTDRALPIDEGQTISQPYVVALMAQALELRGNERILEIGTGSGYAAAVLSLLGAEVTTLERLPALARAAARRLDELGYDNVRVIERDGSAGMPEQAPFDAITVAAAAPWVPRPLREQLGVNGRLIIPVGGRGDQVLMRVRRNGDETRAERLSGVRFVPLIGVHAWESN